MNTTYTTAPLFLGSVLTLALLPSHALASGDPAECGTPDLGFPNHCVSASGDPSVEARLVFVTFPNVPEQALPTWAETMRTEFVDYIAAMSRGAQQLNLTIVRRPDNPDLAWLADHDSYYYSGYGGAGYGALNREIMGEIAQAIPEVWSGVEEVMVVTYRCVFPCEENYGNRCEVGCTLGGIASLGFEAPDPAVPGFFGCGTTQRMFYFGPQPIPINDPVNRDSVHWMAGHEYGHRVGNGHSPGQRWTAQGPPADYVNMGRYDLMRSPPRAALREGLLPYHALHLSNLSNGWLPPIQLITTDTIGLRIPDIRSANAVVYEVPAPGSMQSFVLVNHQGTTRFDQKYLNAGLLIPHYSRLGLRSVAGSLA